MLAGASGSPPDILGPNDPLGTVRVTDGMLAVRCLLPMAASNDDLGWYIFDVGTDTAPTSVDNAQQILIELHTWPIVYQPDTTGADSCDALHENVARIARDILRERFASIEDQADAVAAAMITEFGPRLQRR